MAKYTWQFLHEDQADTIQEFTAAIMNNRHWDQETLQAEFAWERLTPKALNIDKGQLEAAIARLQEAASKKQKVVIFGDYDVDGNCATAIMWQNLRGIGIDAAPFIPHRIRHGYGMSVGALEEIFAAGKPDLIITVDNGITARAALDFCRQEGVDVIVTDHHQPDQAGPLPVVALVHTISLCGAGVAWYLGWQLHTASLGVKPAQSKALQMLDLVALATIVDQVPLVGPCRALVKKGIACLRESQRVGIIALCEQARIKQSALRVRDIGFSLGPRINAIGRLTNTLEALRLLCTSKKTYAAKLAQSLGDVNTSRQELTSQMLETACGQLGQKCQDNIIITGSSEFHEGIIGLIASKLVDKYARPAIVFAIHDGIAKGSARSIEGFDIIAFIRRFRDQLLEAGGHTMAAGLSIAADRFEEVTANMRQTANQVITKQQLAPTLKIETRVKIEALFHHFLPALLEELEPFGAGNPELTIAIDAQVHRVSTIGKDKNHLRLDFVTSKGQYFNALLWNYADSGLTPPSSGDRLQVAGQLSLNDYNGRVSPQLIIQDWRETA